MCCAEHTRGQAPGWPGHRARGGAPSAAHSPWPLASPQALLLALAVCPCRAGRPRIHYTLSKYDEGSMLKVHTDGPA